MNRRTGQRVVGWWLLSAAGAISAIVALGLMWSAESERLGRFGQFADVISAVVAISGFVVAVLALRAVTTDADVEYDSLAALRVRLAIEVQRQWREEEQRRGLHDPWPLPVRFGLSARLVMDDWSVVRGERGDHSPIDLAGHVDDLHELFERIPSRRLVVLGGTGAGKTAAAIRFVVRRLANRSSGDPVPVLLTAATWNPTQQSYRDWLDESLRRRYPILAVRPQLSRQLVEQGHLLVVIDGLDEIAEQWRGSAIVMLNRALQHGHGLLVTCRTEEFEHAISSSDVITAAAVLELQPIGGADVMEYLRIATPPGRRPQWRAVQGELARRPQGALGQALSTPLFASLARMRYADGPIAPGELLAVARRGSATAVERHLLDAFVDMATNQMSSGRNTRRMLAFLASHLYSLRTTELAWWELSRAVPRLFLGLVVGVPAGVVVASVMAAFGMAYRPAGMGAAPGIVMGCFVGYLVTFSAMPAPRARRTVVLLTVRRSSSWRYLLVVPLALVLLDLITPVMWPSGRQALFVLAAVLVAAVMLASPVSEPLVELSQVAWRICLAVLAGLGLGAAAVLAGGANAVIPELHPIFHDAAVTAILSGPRDTTAIGVLLAIVGTAIAVGFALTEVGVLPYDRTASIRPILEPIGRRLAGRLGLTIAMVLGLAVCLFMVGFRPADSADLVKLVLLVPPGAAIALLGFVLFVALGLTMGSVAADNSARERKPYGLRIKFNDMPKIIGPRMTQGLGLGAAVGFMWDVIMGVFDFLSNVVALRRPGMVWVAQTEESSDQLLWIGVGLVIGLMVGITDWVRTSADAKTVVSPRDMVRADRRAVLAAVILAGGLGGGIGAAATVASENSYDWPIAESLIIGSIGAVAIGMPVVLRVIGTTAWIHYRAAHLWLAASGRLPWRFMRLLERARRNGILWQNGGVYKFRHVRIQELLKDQVWGPGRR